MYHAGRSLDYSGSLIRKASASQPGDTRSVWLCTNDDGGGQTEQEDDMLVQMARDGRERGIDLEVRDASPVDPTHTQP